MCRFILTLPDFISAGNRIFYSLITVLVLLPCQLSAFATVETNAANLPADAPKAAEEALRSDRGLALPAINITSHVETKESAPKLDAIPKASNMDRAGIDAQGTPQWLALEPGLDFGEFRFEGGDFRLTALRIDPEKFNFQLCASSEDGNGPRSLAVWGEERDLAGAINASMYREDGSTSTGYMRAGEHINNPRLAERFGAFFVAGPRNGELPKAAIIDRDLPNWQENIANYDLVIQNYRMINADRRILWSPGGPLYSISAVAQDGTGKILFLHSRTPVEAYAFAQQLLHLPLDVRTVMYVEGGAQAGLLVRSQALRRELGGAHAPSFLVTGNLKALLPNVLGVRRKETLSPDARPSAQSK